MPFVWAGELGVAGAAFLAALLCMGVYLLLRAIAAALPKINFAVITIDFGKIFLAIVSPAVWLLTHAAEGLFSVAEAILRSIGWMLTELFDGIKDVLGLHATQVAHIYNSVIPEQAQHAASSAAGYTAGRVAELRQEIATTRTDLEHLAAADSASEWAKAEKLVGTVRHELTAISATGVRTAERYADGQVHKLSGELEKEIADLRAKVGVAAPPSEVVVSPPVAAPVPVAGADLSTQVGLLTGTVAGIATSVATLTSEFESCAVTSCAGPNNLSSLLQGLLGIADLAVVGAFLAQLIHSPAAAVDEYASVFEGLVSDGESALDALLSL